MSLAFVFPGQGSQSLGMLSELSAEFSIVEETFKQASEVLGYDLWQLVSEGPVENLNQTDKTQPAMLAAGIAVWRVWQQQSDIKPNFFAGHSLGEYSALVASGALAFEDAIKLVAKRGEFMQQAVPAGEGAMAAILGLDDNTVAEVCAEASTVGLAEAVNFNSPGQVVIAGEAKAIERATEIAKEKGAKRALILPVSVPSHCALMQPAAENLAQELNSINVSMPTTTVIHNTNVNAATSEEEIKLLLTQQLHKPVRWVETIEAFAEQGVTTVIECGPGKVLAGLTKRINKTLVSLPVFDTASLNKAIDALGE
jgi:[acyl-carrier-protein] S-malonyltransferase